jgi:hypothetical protein
LFHFVEAATEVIEVVPELTSLAHQSIEVLISAVCKVAGIGLSGLIGTLSPSPHVFGEVQELLTLQFGFLLKLLPLPLQRLSAVATVLFLKQLVLQRVVAQEAGEALIQLPFQLLQPTHV